MDDYLSELRRTISSMSQQVADVLSREVTDTPPVIKVGSWVLQKQQKFHWHQPRYKGPFQVVESTDFCVKVQLTPDKVSNWIHKTQCVLSEEPGERTLREVREDLANLDSDGDQDE